MTTLALFNSKLADRFREKFLELVANFKVKEYSKVIAVCRQEILSIGVLF